MSEVAAVHRGSMAIPALRAGLRTGLIGPVAPWRLRRMIATGKRLGAGIGSACAISAIRSPGAPALIDELGTLSFGELDRRANAIAGAIERDYGVGGELALAVMCRNHRGFAQSLLAASLLGADVLALNTEFPGPQLAQALERHRVGAIVIDDEFTRALSDSGYRGPQILQSALEELGRGRGRPTRPPAGRSRMIILSSGTTGTPKGAARSPSAKEIGGSFVTLLDHLPLRRGAPILVCPPLFHGFGLSFFGLAMFLGSPVVLRSRFDPAAALDDIDAHRVRMMVGVPVMLQRILALGPEARAERDLSSLKGVASAGAPLSPHLATSFMDGFGDLLFNLYGSTEAGFGAIAGPADLRATPGCVGRAPIGVQARLLDDLHQPVAPGESGHIYVGSEMLIDGYTDGGKREVAGGLMNTGDLGHLDSEGRLFVDGREDDMIVSGGENVFPGEVEDVLGSHPGVREAAVYGVPDDEFGQRLQAFVAAGPGITAEELIGYLRERVARYKLPREIVFVEALPRTATGKVVKRELLA